jgi:hypothetical protein
LSDLNSGQLGHDEDDGSLSDGSQEKGTVLAISGTNEGSSGEARGQGDRATQDTGEPVTEEIADAEK